MVRVGEGDRCLDPGRGGTDSIPEFDRGLDQVFGFSPVVLSIQSRNALYNG